MESSGDVSIEVPMRGLPNSVLRASVKRAYVMRFLTALNCIKTHCVCGRCLRYDENGRPRITHASYFPDAEMSALASFYLKHEVLRDHPDADLYYSIQAAKAMVLAMSEEDRKVMLDRFVSLF